MNALITVLAVTVGAFWAFDYGGSAPQADEAPVQILAGYDPLPIAVIAHINSVRIQEGEIALSWSPRLYREALRLALAAADGNASDGICLYRHAYTMATGELVTRWVSLDARLLTKDYRSGAVAIVQKGSNYWYVFVGSEYGPND